MSSAAIFDQSFYLTNNADVVVAISQGNFASALDHYNQFGGKELRAPNGTFNPQYYAVNNSDVLNAVAAGTFANVFAHYQSFGETENRAPSTALSTFDATSYLAANADVAAAVTAGTFSSALDHYIAFGQNESRTGSGVTASITPGDTLTLTTGADTLTGGSGDDVFVALVDDNTAANNTLSALDTLAGGDGNDTLQITADTSASALAFPGAAVSGIETFLVRNASGQTLTINTALVSDETSIINDRSTASTIITNAADGTTVEQRGNEVATVGALSATYVAAATSASLNMTGGIVGANNITMDGSGLTTLALTSSGAANTVGNIDSSGNITSASLNATSNLTAARLSVGTNTGTQTLTITGSGNVAIGTIDNDFASVDASALTGNLTVTGNATAAAGITAGSGSDTITTGVNSLTGTISGGEGTDTLDLAASTHLDSTAEGAQYTNFETLEVNDNVTVDMDNVTGSTITAIVLEDAGNATIVQDMNATQAANVRIDALAGAASLLVKNAANVGQQDTLTITVSDGDATGSEAIAGTGNLTTTGIETINITATDDITLADMRNMTGIQSLTISGGGDVSVTTNALALGTNVGFDFSGLTAASTFDASAATANAFAFTGGSGADTVSLNVVGGSIVNTGAGNDAITDIAITSGTASVQITMGAGADDLNVNTKVGNDAGDQIFLIFADGDTISQAGATNLVDTGATGVTDLVSSIDAATATAGAGQVIDFDTPQQATATTFSTAAVVSGVTTVTNAFDFYVRDINGITGSNAIIYQDTDGDGTIEAGEFAIQIAASAQLVTGEFTISGGDLLFTSA